MHTHTVAVPGCNLHYTVSGSGAPLLLIPALGGEAWWYHKLLPLLATHFTVITYDQRGCGQSVPSTFPSCVSTQSRDALSVLQAAGKEAAHVVGLSSGGVIALDLATHYPQAVLSVLAFEPPMVRLHPDSLRWQRFVANTFASAFRRGPAWAGLKFALGAGLPVKALLQGAKEQQQWLAARQLSKTARSLAEEYLDFITTTLYLPAPQLFDDGIPVYAAVGLHSLQKQRFYAQTAQALARQAGTPLVIFPGHHLSSFHDAEAWSRRLLAHLQALT